ncbi:hypothetical protein [Zongyangia hominis]|uniref:Uncharacterized protein n=1 Tax=Zongyangia hominis TaxID=2763677 RepID=A0A926IBQ5_9FIRM|nr:hypothetical protein [Zongyangia hominis]MBC8570528.1 hypothetical protein [Zongyangia hominis]
MDMRIQNGDFVPDRRGIPRGCFGVEEVVNRVLLCLTARRGGFARMPHFGSRLHTLRGGTQERMDEQAAMMVREALEGVDEVRVGDVSTARMGSVLTVRVGLQMDAGDYDVKVGVSLD